MENTEYTQEDTQAIYRILKDNYKINSTYRIEYLINSTNGTDYKLGNDFNIVELKNFKYNLTNTKLIIQHANSEAKECFLYKRLPLDVLHKSEPLKIQTTLSSLETNDLLFYINQYYGCSFVKGELINETIEIDKVKFYECKVDSKVCLTFNEGVLPVEIIRVPEDLKVILPITALNGFDKTE